MQKNKYNLSMRILHWLMAIIIIGLLIAGLYMQGLPDTVSYKFTLYNLHKSFGVIVLMLILLRFPIRVFSKIPPLPRSFATWEKILAKTVHYLLYLAMFTMPISGYLMSNSHGHGVKLFTIELPKVIEKHELIGKITHATHHYGGYIIIFLLTLHILGALKHKYIDKHSVFERMV